MSHPSPDGPAEQLPPLRLTRRGKVVLAVLALLLVLGFAQLVKGCGSDEPRAASPASGTATPPGQSSSAPGQASTPGANPSTTASPTPSATRTSILDGMTYSGDVGSGTFVPARLELATSHRDKTSAHHYVLQVESNLDLKTAEVARQVQSILDDERSWVGSTKNSFSLVSDPAKADLTIMLASPDTTDRLCKPLNVLKTWSCNHGNKVILNADRWRFMTPTYTDLTEYRAYMVNHEVGHFIGRGHLDCPGSGEPGPVMMQQSKSLGGCSINPWPAGSKGR